MNVFGGLQIIEDINMTDLVEDWSEVRSPSRARRRRKKHRQRIVTRLVPKAEAYQVGNQLIMHPSRDGPRDARADSSGERQQWPVI